MERIGSGTQRALSTATRPLVVRIRLHSFLQHHCEQLSLTRAWPPGAVATRSSPPHCSRSAKFPRKPQPQRLSHSVSCKVGWVSGRVGG
jgi:hypothetical protein